MIGRTPDPRVPAGPGRTRARPARGLGAAVLAAGVLDLAVLDLLLVPAALRAGDGEARPRVATRPAPEPGIPALEPPAADLEPPASARTAPWRDTRPQTSPGPLRLRFPSGSAALPEGAAEAASTFAAELRARPELRLVIEGHADERGSATQNLGLSRRRALRFAALLRRATIPRDRVVIRAFGERRPADPSRSHRALAENRRVEVYMEVRP